ncbi:MAG TPA: DUF6323 family protein [Candidatus Acidoferrum sp.]|nr:DUF6323 family protein [Candidatus Acidoferrum sp.]
MNYSLSIIEKGLLAANTLSAPFGLALSAHDAAMVAAAKLEAVRESGRVEFSGGVEQELIRAFSPSPYIEQRAYAETLCELFEIFYEQKNQLPDDYPDDDLIIWMADAFNGRCGGSLEALRGLKPMEEPWRPEPEPDEEQADE